MSKIKKMRAKFYKDNQKYWEKLNKELNYEPTPIEPKFERIKIYGKDGAESYNCPEYLPKTDFISINYKKKAKLKVE